VGGGGLLLPALGQLCHSQGLLLGGPAQPGLGAQPQGRPCASALRLCASSPLRLCLVAVRACWHALPRVCAPACGPSPCAIRAAGAASDGRRERETAPSRSPRLHGRRARAAGVCSQARQASGGARGGGGARTRAPRRRGARQASLRGGVENGGRAWVGRELGQACRQISPCGELPEHAAPVAARAGAAACSLPPSTPPARPPAREPVLQAGARAHRARGARGCVHRARVGARARRLRLGRRRGQQR
jgi:hypothetical protein